MIKLWLFLQTSKNKACITTIFHTFMFWIPNEIQIQLNQFCLISATRWSVFSASVVYFCIDFVQSFQLLKQWRKWRRKKSWQKAEIIITTQVSSTQWLLCKTWGAVSIVSLVQKNGRQNFVLAVWITALLGRQRSRHRLIDWAAKNIGAILSLTKGLAIVSLLIGKFLHAILTLAGE